MAVPTRHLLPLILPLQALSLPSQGAYRPHDSYSFEAPRFKVGTLAGKDLVSGQDGWLVTDDGDYPPPVQAISLQTKVVRSGKMAGSWDAKAYAAKKASFAHLRTNQIFSYKGQLDVELDISMHQHPTQAKTVWGLNAQFAPHPGSSMFYWIVKEDGEIWMMQGSVGIKTWWVKTGVKLTRYRWHHTRTVVDPAAFKIELYVDGKQVGKGFKPIYYCQQKCGAVHGFTSIVMQQTDKATLYFDNFRVRARNIPELLSSDLVEVKSGTRAKVEFRMNPGAKLARKSYLLLGSLSGSKPGLKLPGGKTLPLNFDNFSMMTLANLNSPWFQGFAKVFDANGWARATWDSQLPLPTAAKGLTLHFAYLTIPKLDQVSEPWSLTIR